MIWQDISTVSSKKSKVKKKGSDGVSIAPDGAQLQGQCMTGTYNLILLTILLSLYLSVWTDICVHITNTYVSTCVINWCLQSF